MNKKTIIVILFGFFLVFGMGVIIITPILMLLDFFGINVTDGYVENNIEYAEEYRSVVSKYLMAGNGYVSLDRILYFYTEDDSLSFDEIYTDNLDTDLKQVKPISEVCSMDKYKLYSVCSESELSESNQINDEQNKPFNSPLDFIHLNVTSFFMEERIINGEYDIHNAWDFYAVDQTPVYSVCDGTVETVSFNFINNIIDVNGGYGNHIVISCEVDDIHYKVLYGHLYPESTSLKVGDTVSEWQQVASVGLTGFSTGSHLHFETKLNGKTIDGVSLIDFTNTNDNTNPFTPIGPIAPYSGTKSDG